MHTFTDLMRPIREAEERRHAALRGEMEALTIEQLWLRLDATQKTIDGLYRQTGDLTDEQDQRLDAAQDVLDFARLEMRRRLNEFLGDEVPLDEALEAAR